MRLSRFQLIAIVVLACLTFSGTWARAAQAEGGLLNLVGDDVGAVIEMNDLRGNRKSLAGCEILQRLKETEFLRRWKTGNDYQKLVAGQKVIEQLVGKSLGQFVDDVFGSSVVLAVYPTDSSQSDVVLVTRANRPKALVSALDAWNRAERAELTPLTFGGESYVRRARRRADQQPLPAQYYFHSKTLLAFSNSEAEIQRVISLHSKPAPASFINSAAFKQAQELPAKRFVSLYLNPRAWDDQVIEDGDESNGGKYLKTLWRRCDSIAFGLTVDPQGLVINGTAHLRDSNGGTDVTSVAVSDSDAVDDIATLPQFLSQVPRRAVALFAGEHELARIAQLVIGWISDKDQDDWYRVRSLGRGLLIGFDLFEDVLPAIGKNWGTYVVSTHGMRRKQTPLDLVIGVELPPPGKISHGKITLRDALDNALQTALRVVAKAPAGNNAETSTDAVATLQSNGISIRSVQTGKSIQPAFALTPHHVLAGTSPDVVQEFLNVRREDSLETEPQFRAIAARRFPHGQQLAYINAAALRKVVEANESLFSTRLADSKAKTKSAALQRIRGFRDLLTSFDAVYLSSRTSGGRLHLSAGIVVNPLAAE